MSIYPFFTSALEGGERSAPRPKPQPLYPLETNPLPIEQEAVWNSVPF